MLTNIFINLPVKDLNKSKEFWGQLGFTFNKQFTDETAASLILGKNFFVMLLKHNKYSQFTKKEIVDTSKMTEVINAFSVESKEEVDELLEKVLKAGGKELDKNDYGFMYSRAFEDLDGHLWEVLWMDPKYVEKY